MNLCKYIKSGKRECQDRAWEEAICTTESGVQRKRWCQAGQN